MALYGLLMVVRFELSRYVGTSLHSREIITKTSSIEVKQQRFIIFYLISHANLLNLTNITKLVLISTLSEILIQSYPRARCLPFNLSVTVAPYTFICTRSVSGFLSS